MPGFSESGAKGRDQSYWDKRRATQEKKVRETMAEKPDISLAGLRKEIGGGNGNLSIIYHRVRGEMSSR